ncbi:uncharacterized protein C8R40DRAFT_1210747 [Lentinula edodes]|uniref:uncharacterized protein n=1 Tax=Lentinula edodes TaxID=5353 RepID=UPI001E8DB598|nr:uncharacterized protein C8R40DRAFT_1210747 [Lentinula edodes]KAH7870907.1 hypothetical protein C8R40DRAFT_1210747 [Lentinula edodes]
MDDPSSLTQGDPWFQDGNIILVSRDESGSSELPERPPVGFRVHRGVLSRHSEVLRDMFELPQPDTMYDNDNDASRYEGCQVITMYDIPIELSNLVKALYDGVTFHNRSVDDFFYLAGILRLSTKYVISHLRTQAIKHLTQTWSYDLKGHDNMLDLAIRTPQLSYSSDPNTPSKLSYPYIHPIHVLNLARSTNVRIVVPSALYFLSLYPLTDLLRADHPKLQVAHPSKPSSSLQPSDLVNYTLICTNGTGRTCTRNFQRLGMRLASSWVVRTGPFNFIGQTMSQVSQNTEGFCAACRGDFATDVGAFRQKFWDDLPAVCGLPAWDVMREEELS